MRSIDSLELVRAKTQLLDELRDLEAVMEILSAEEKEEQDASDASSSSSQEKDPIDSHYDRLRCAIAPLDRAGDEFLVQQYVAKTHAPTHSEYTLELLDAFSLEREGEKQRFEQEANLENHQLLWHGSRLGNYPGILSQGLRIAPPEAPSTGYMFGKGAYFANSVSKSANYCFPSQGDNTVGCLLLAQVALGRSCEKLEAEFVKKLPGGYDSTWEREIRSQRKRARYNHGGRRY